MGFRTRIVFYAQLAAVAVGCVCAACPARSEVTEIVLHTFSGGTDGGSVYGGLLLDATRALSGTTGGGGNLSAALCPGFGCGTVFRLTPPARGQTAWTLTTLWNFSGTDGDVPLAALFAPDESPFPLYGTTSGLNGGNGTIFRVTDRVLTTLWSFSGGSDGGFPSGALIRDERGALYGTTEGGGTFSGPACIGFGCGTVFAIGNAAGSLTTIWSFSGGDGAGPSGTLLADTTGALYGTTSAGGVSNPACGFTGTCGTVFKLTPPAGAQTAWALTTLWNFTGGSDGANPLLGALIADETGALYGTTNGGGASGNGVVFKLSPPAGGQTVWTLSTLWSFSGGIDGGFPVAGVIADRQGALYGTTTGGGASGNGVVFKLTPRPAGQTPWTETVLRNFSGSDGELPNAGVIADDSGALYGTTQFGGALNLCSGLGCGVVFKLTGTGFAPCDHHWDTAPASIDGDFHQGRFCQGGER